MRERFSGGYFHKTKTSYGARLEHPLVARISLAGYATKELTLTAGPQNWVSLNGRSRGEYWLFKTDRVHVELRPISETFTGEIVARVSDTSAGLQPELSLEERAANQACRRVLEGIGQIGHWISCHRHGRHRDQRARGARRGKPAFYV
ncbi:MAG TPA: hypothetical protein VIW93_12110 [Candidatus Acidoferrum sp.]